MGGTAGPSVEPFGEGLSLFPDIDVRAFFDGVGVFASSGEGLSVRQPASITTGDSVGMNVDPEQQQQHRPSFATYQPSTSQPFHGPQQMNSTGGPQQHAPPPGYQQINTAIAPQWNTSAHGFQHNLPMPHVYQQSAPVHGFSQNARTQGFPQNIPAQGFSQNNHAQAYSHNAQGFPQNTPAQGFPQTTPTQHSLHHGFPQNHAMPQVFVPDQYLSQSAFPAMGTPLVTPLPGTGVNFQPPGGFASFQHTIPQQNTSTSQSHPVPPSEHSQSRNANLQRTASFTFTSGPGSQQITVSQIVALGNMSIFLNLDLVSPQHELPAAQELDNVALLRPFDVNRRCKMLLQPQLFLSKPQRVSHIRTPKMHHTPDDLRLHQAAGFAGCLLYLRWMRQHRRSPQLEFRQP